MNTAASQSIPARISRKVGIVTIQALHPMMRERVLRESVLL